MNIFLNEYFGFCFELNFELNHFQAKFNEKMNFQNVSNRANTTGRAQIKSLVQYLYQYQHLYDPIFVICSFHLSASQRLSQSVNRSDIHFWLYFHKIWKKVLILGKLEFVIRLIKATLLQYQIDGERRNMQLCSHFRPESKHHKRTFFGIPKFATKQR